MVATLGEQAAVVVVALRSLPVAPALAAVVAVVAPTWKICCVSCSKSCAHFLLAVQVVVAARAVAVRGCCWLALSFCCCGSPQDFIEFSQISRAW